MAKPRRRRPRAARRASRPSRSCPRASAPASSTGSPCSPAPRSPARSPGSTCPCSPALAVIMPSWSATRRGEPPQQHDQRGQGPSQEDQPGGGARRSDDDPHGHVGASTSPPEHLGPPSAHRRASTRTPARRARRRGRPWPERRGHRAERRLSARSRCSAPGADRLRGSTRPSAPGRHLGVALHEASCTGGPAARSASSTSRMRCTSAKAWADRVGRCGRASA